MSLRWGRGMKSFVTLLSLFSLLSLLSLSLLVSSSLSSLSSLSPFELFQYFNERVGDWVNGEGDSRQALNDALDSMKEFVPWLLSQRQLPAGLDPLVRLSLFLLFLYFSRLSL